MFQRKWHHSRMQSAGIGSFTFVGDDVWVSEFRLAPGDPRWRTINRTTDLAVLTAFPRTTVAIRHEARGEIVADPLSAVVYNPGQPYRRRLISPTGDDCTVLAVTRELVADAASEFDGSAADPASYRLPFPAVTIGRGEYLVLERLRQWLMRGTSDSREAMQEEIYAIVFAVIAGGYEAIGRHAPARPSTSKSHREIADDLRERLGRDIAATSSLEELAADVGVSPFHLARLFRRQIGRPIHAYRTELRLRASLAMIADGVRLADVAQQVGFASHAHLTDRFVRTFGLTPVAWRASLRRQPREMSRIVEASGGRSFLA